MLDEIQEVNTPEIAFLLGYLVGDGCFRVHKRPLVDGSFSLHKQFYVSDSCDLNILQWIECNFPNTGIRTRSRNIKGKERTSHTLYFPKKFYLSFQKFGIFDYKENRDLLNIPDELFLFALQGLSLADGCIYIRYREDCKTPTLNFCIAHQSRVLFEKIKTKLNLEYSYPISLRKRSNEKVIYLDCQHTNYNKKFLRTLFLDTPCLIDHEKVKKTRNYLELYPERK